jgi:hypothetical protein
MADICACGYGGARYAAIWNCTTNKMAQPTVVDFGPPEPPRVVAPAGGPPYNGDMEHRVTVIETRLDSVLPTLATKSDVADAKASLVMWGTGVAATAVAVIVAVMVFVVNRAVPPSAPSSLLQPIIIQLPPPPTASVTAPAPDTKK